MVRKLGLNQPDNGIAFNEEEAVATASRIGYPVLVRPSYVLGGRAMAIIYDQDGVEKIRSAPVTIYMKQPTVIPPNAVGPALQPKPTPRGG